MRLCIALLAALSIAAPAWAAEDKLSFERFGTVTVYRGEAEPEAVVLFVSGDGGWNQGVLDMARSLAGLGALVVGVDIVAYLRKAAAADDKCTYVAGDFERLSQFVQKTYGLTRYRVPVLVGYSSGATLVYATLVQAPTGTFRGAISLGFCPDLKTAKPLCKGRGLAWSSDQRLGSVYQATGALGVPWTALHGDADQVCDLAQTRGFVERVPNGQLVALPKVGHGFSVQRNWMPQFKAAFARITKADGPATGSTASAVGDLPLVELPAKRGQTERFAILLTGDGGWAGLDRDLGAALAEQGMPVVGFNSLSYFWTRRSPDEAAADLARVIEHYATSWNRPRVTLIGYSFGADVLPLMARRLSPALRSQVDKLVLLGPSDSAVLEFRVADWIGGRRADALPVRPEIDALQGVSLLCVYGVDEKQSLCRTLSDRQASKLETKGGHHFGGDVGSIVKAILEP